MGNALNAKVNDLLQGVVVFDRSAVQMGLRSSYRATRGRLLPQRLNPGFLLSGEISELSVSTQALAAVGAIFGVAPPVKAEVHGLRLVLEPAGVEQPAAGGGAAAGAPGRGPAAAGADLEQQLTRLEVDVHDASFEVRLGGRVVHLRVDRLQALPYPPSNTGRSAGLTGDWEVRHEGLKVDVEGRQAATLPQGDAKVRLSALLASAVAAAASAGSVHVEMGARLACHVDDEQLLAVLDLAAAAVAVGASQEGGQSGPANGPSWKVILCDIAVRLDAAGGALLEAKSGVVSASGVAAARAEVWAEPLEVRCGGEEAGGAWERSRRAVLRMGAASAGAPLELGFAGQAPWRGAVELLLDDPRFQAHRAWLELACGISGAGGRKRPREDAAEDGADQPPKRSRL